MRLNTLFLALSILMACTLSTTEGRTDSPKAPLKEAPKVVIETALKTVEFNVTLAVTPAERQKGLMFQETLKDNSGMLFIFPKTEVHSFWMKNTFLPLDMIFIDERMKIVGIVENAEPMTTTSRAVNKASKYVLEVTAGTCRRLSIKSQQKVIFQHINHASIR
jgi:uncharacterized protein